MKIDPTESTNKTETLYEIWTHLKWRPSYKILQLFMEACVGINRTDDFLYESMTEPIGIERMIYCIHMIFRNIQHSQ